MSQKEFSVAWQREVGGVDVNLNKSFETSNERELFIQDNLDGLEDIELSEIEV